MVDMIFLAEMTQLIYKIPSTFLMILSVYVISKEIRKKNVHFNKQFYSIIVCKLVNEIFYIITYYLLVKLPKWGLLNNFLEKNNWVAKLFYVLTIQQTTFMFLITFLISINRCVAIKYPAKYKCYFSKSNMITTITLFIMLSTLIGFGSIPLNPAYGLFSFIGIFIPYSTSKNVIYYQMFCYTFFFGTISITTCTLNVLAILELKKHKYFVNYYKREIVYIIYSIFIFITLSIVEAFSLIKIIAEQYEIHLLYYIFFCFQIWAFDLPFLGDFYFLIYSR
uniref:Serpentine receptor class gamma n=1 Tax=Strongyloides venezuelensis TaxID=75913 RepID=A0A0K0EU15_STRVS